MKFITANEAAQEFRGDAVVVFLKLDGVCEDKNLQKLVDLTHFKAKSGAAILLNLVEGFGANHVIVAGLGEDASGKNYVKALQAVSAILAKIKAKTVLIERADIDGFDAAWTHATAARTLQNATYKVQKTGAESAKNSLETIAIQSDLVNSAALARGQAMANGQMLARELGDLPSNICTPTYLAQCAQSLAQEFNLDCEILDAPEMEALGMGALLSVSKGSIEPPKLISLQYRGDGEARPFVLVGKGVTFDSGGISLKPGTAMDEMKFDMCGAASVLGVMRTIAQLQPKLNLTIIVPAVENMPAHNASKPGDVVTSMSGQTIEILNTDAEGRMILCDALTFAKRFQPRTIIDVATLTGAVIMALGKHHSGLMSNDDALVADLIDASKTALDGVWQLPMDAEYDELLQSNFADMANIGGREAGSVTAACFLARFTQDYRWAHLDIAGTAWVSGKNKGATGRPVALLAQYILNNSAA